MKLVATLSVALLLAGCGAGSTAGGPPTSAAANQGSGAVTTTGGPQSGTGVSGGLLGTTARTDGTTEVTYAGHPLYYFLNDKASGDTKGQGVNGFGGLWWVLNPSGAAVTTK